MREYLKIIMDKAGLNFVELFLEGAPVLEDYNSDEAYLEALNVFATEKGIDELAIRQDTINRAYTIPTILEHQTEDLFFLIPLLEGSDILAGIVTENANVVRTEKVTADIAEALFTS
jgi:hypothetical protein